MENEIRMTKLASCAGCGAKVGAGTLAKLLQGLPSVYDENLLVGYDTSDDACVYKISDDLVLVNTLDFFPPIVDDPFMFGQIAAANAISDVYAMGATPKLALNIMAVSPQMPDEAVREVLRGGYTKAAEAGVIISGGHTIRDPEPKYGLSVSGYHVKAVSLGAYPHLSVGVLIERIDIAGEGHTTIHNSAIGAYPLAAFVGSIHAQASVLGAYPDAAILTTEHGTRLLVRFQRYLVHVIVAEVHQRQSALLCGVPQVPLAVNAVLFDAVRLHILLRILTDSAVGVFGYQLC